MPSEFTQEWLEAWNTHDLDRIMDHYAEKLDFVSPLVKKLGISGEGRITEKAVLREYFARGLQTYPDLKFEFYHELRGYDSVVLFYRSINNSYSAEYMELNEDSKIVRVRAHYAFPETAEGGN